LKEVIDILEGNGKLVKETKKKKKGKKHSKK
jgi:hypothetical protein